MNIDCYWFEAFTWWRLTKKAPCLPDVIETKRTSAIIYEHSLFNMEEAIKYLNYIYCDWNIQNVRDDSTTLSCKNLPWSAIKTEQSADSLEFFLCFFYLLLKVRYNLEEHILFHNLDSSFSR